MRPGASWPGLECGNAAENTDGRYQSADDRRNAEMRRYLAGDETGSYTDAYRVHEAPHSLASRPIGPSCANVTTA